MYTLAYRLYFHLKRIQKLYKENNKEIRGIKKRLLEYSEWFFNVPIKRYYEKHSTSKIGINTKNREERINVSLTSFPKRINTVWLAIESLMRQTMKPDMIILWLAESQFNGIHDLPQQLLDQQKRGLTIRFCEDLKSHKKYFFAMQEFPNDLIILADDDIIYSKDLVKQLYGMHKKYPNDIVCMSAQYITKFDEMPSKWRALNVNENMKHSYSIQAYSGAGSLFPPGSLDNEYAFDRNLIAQLCPYADDLWLKYMSYKRGIYTTAIYPNRYLPIMIDGTGSSGLWYINGEKNQNDVQWKSITEYFGTIKE